MLPQQTNHQTVFGNMFAMPYVLFLPLLPLLALCVWAGLFLVPQYRMPEEIPYWVLFFGLPHIISSFQTICDKEYIVSYKKQLTIIAVLTLLPYILILLGVPSTTILTVFIALTVHHVVVQQLGISMWVARLRPTMVFKICKWSTLGLGIVAFHRPYFLPNMGGNAYLDITLDASRMMVIPLLLVMVVSGALLCWSARKNKLGSLLLAVNLLLFLFALILILKTEYTLIGLMLVRVLHDITGFVIYMKHDSARNENIRSNILYRPFGLIPVWLLNPLLAITVAAVLTQLSADFQFIAWLIVGLTAAHYYMEGVIWRKGTPHRQHINLCSD